MNNPDPAEKTLSENERFELIAQLTATEDKLPDDLRQKILAAGPAIVEDLIELIVDDLDLAEDEEGGWASIHAAKLLGEIGDARAVSVLLDCLEECESLEYLFNEAMFALEAIGVAIIEPCLDRYVSTISDDLRNLIASILCDLGVADERFYQIATETLERDLTLGANCFYGLGDERAIPLLSAKFDEFEVDPTVDIPLANQDLIELQAAIEHLGGRLTVEQERKLDESDEPRRRFRKNLERLAELRAAEAENRPMANRQVPVVNKRKIGRNEPCWCGSGKKYKKCHLPLERE